MEEIAQLKQQLEKQEKLASLGMLSAGIAHEIQNPLNFVINFSKMSERLLDDLVESVENGDTEDIKDIVSSLKSNMAQIVESGERAVSIIQGILLVSRGKENEFIPSDVCKIVKEYVWLSYHAMRAGNHGFNVAIHEDYADNLPMTEVIPQDLSRAVLNVMNNACYAVWRKAEKVGEGYSPEINVKVESLPMQGGVGGGLLISISDNGEGMSDEVKERLFENFFTTKPIGHGTGLGMGITRDIIENKHGGKLTFTSQEGVGTTFTFEIPFKRS